MTETFGPYELDRRIAYGARSELWLARDSRSTQEAAVVVKRLTPEMASRVDAIAELRREGDVGHRLDHPNLVRTSQTKQLDDGRWYLTREYVEGVALGQLMTAMSRRGERLPTPLCLYIASEAAAGLGYLHERRRDDSPHPLRTVHRDVCPANILLHRDGRVLLSDYGLAYQLDEDDGSLRGAPGTLGYQAPEVARGDALSGLADLFSLGVVLWELVSGRRMRGDLPNYAILSRMSRPAPPLPQGTPPNVRGLIHRCLALSDRERPPNAIVLSEELGQMTDQPRGKLKMELAARLRAR